MTAPLDRVRAALETASGPPHGAHGRQCPAHDDRQAFLSVITRTGGGVLPKCHRNCEPDAVVPVLGLTMADLFPEPKRDYSRPEIVARYLYVDEHGELLFETIRYAPKAFRQRQPDGRAGWTWDLNGVRRVPSRLPQLLAAVADGQPIWVCEDEKDVAALEAAGVVATYNPVGARKGRDDYAQFLAGAELVAAADRDRDKTGDKHAAHGLGQDRTLALDTPARHGDAPIRLRAALGSSGRPPGRDPCFSHLVCRRKSLPWT